MSDSRRVRAKSAAEERHRPTVTQRHIGEDLPHEPRHAFTGHQANLHEGFACERRIGAETEAPCGALEAKR
jgi:hypothetical protein